MVFTMKEPDFINVSWALPTGTEGPSSGMSGPKSLNNASEIPQILNQISYFSNLSIFILLNIKYFRLASDPGPPKRPNSRT